MTCARPADHRGFECPALVVLGMFLGVTSSEGPPLQLFFTSAGSRELGQHLEAGRHGRRDALGRERTPEAK
jgi:hypothetical protein